jgi:hypothetical protein
MPEKNSRWRQRTWKIIHKIKFCSDDFPSFSQASAVGVRERKGKSFELRRGKVESRWRRRSLKFPIRFSLSLCLSLGFHSTNNFFDLRHTWVASTIHHSRCFTSSWLLAWEWVRPEISRWLEKFASRFWEKQNENFPDEMKAAEGWKWERGLSVGLGLMFDLKVIKF